MVLLSLFSFFAGENGFGQYKFDWIKDSYMSGISSKGEVYSVQSYAQYWDLDLIDGLPTGYPPPTLDGDYDISIAKYDSTGKYLWCKTLPNMGEEQLKYSTVSDDMIFIFGTFQDSMNVSFDTLNPHWLGANGQGMFLCAYDTSLNLVSALGTEDQSSTMLLKQISRSRMGNGFYVFGEFSSTLDFDMSAGTSFLTAKDDDIFIAHYNSAGGFQWAQQWGSIVEDRFALATLSESDRIIIAARLATGNFAGTQTFQLGPNSYNLQAFSGYATIWAGSGSSGQLDFSWLASNAGIKGITIGPDSNIYVLGAFDNSVDFDEDSIPDLSMAGQANGFIAKFDPAMNYLLSRGFSNGVGRYLSFIGDANYNNYIGACGSTLTAQGYYMEFMWLDTNLDTIQTKSYASSFATGLERPAYSRSGELYFEGGMVEPVIFEPGPLPLLGKFGTCKITPYCHSLVYHGPISDTVTLCNDGEFLNYYYPGAAVGVLASGTGLRYQWIQQYTTVAQDFDNPPTMAVGAQASIFYTSLGSSAPLTYFPFYCRIHNGCGDSLISDTIIVREFTAPNPALIQTYQVSPPMGVDYIMNCPPALYPVYLWMQGNFALFDNQKFSGTSTDQLTIHSLNGADAGVYTCYAGNTECSPMIYYPYVNYILTPTGGVGGSDPAEAVSGSLSLSPNPAQDHLLLNTGCAKVEDLVIFDHAGRTVTCPIFPSTNGMHRIDIQDISKGVYWITGTCKNQKFHAKFVKQ